jgi:hypothetical protein
MNYNLTTKNNTIEISLENKEYIVSLARTGGQGSKGDTVTNAFINQDNDLVIEVTNSSGVVTQIIAGNINSSLALGGLSDVTINSLADGDYLAYEAASSNYKNYRLTTSRVRDIDNTNRQDGSMLVYNSSTAHYVATNNLNNPNLIITGGNY